MKVFIRTSEINESSPRIMASYADNSGIAPDVHGDEMTMLEVPDSIIQPPKREGNKEQTDPFHRLPENWRERLTNPILQAEAKRRVDEVLGPGEQVSTLHEIIDLILQHGTDVSKWPQQAKARKAELDEVWSYVRDIRGRVRALRSLPSNPASDKNWPERIKRK